MATYAVTAPTPSRSKLGTLEAGGYFVAARRLAQYFFIRTLTAFLAAADVPLGFSAPDFSALIFAHRARCAAAIAARPAADSLLRFLRATAFFGLVPPEALAPATPGNAERIAEISVSSSRIRTFAPARAKFIKVS